MGESIVSRELFSPAAVEPETAQLNAGIEKVLAEMPLLHTLPPSEIRAARERGEGIWGPIETVPEAEVREVPGPAGVVPIRVVPPQETPVGVYLHLHGGGWVLGAAHHFDPMHRRIARACRMVVVSVDYRLAPEHPYPAAPDDCEAAALWTIENAEKEFGTARVAIGGESAGAHLAVATLLRLRDRHGFTGIASASLAYGAYDLTLTPSVRRWGERNLILSTPLIEWFTDQFVSPELRAHPDVSPLYADLSGMPPALLTIGTEDPLLDDSLFLHARWIAAGSPAKLAVYPGGAHGFNAFPIPLAERANQRIESFLRETIADA